MSLVNLKTGLTAEETKSELSEEQLEKLMKKEQDSAELMMLRSLNKQLVLRTQEQTKLYQENAEEMKAVLTEMKDQIERSLMDTKEDLTQTQEVLGEELKLQLRSCTEALTDKLKQLETANTAFLTTMKAETVGLKAALKEALDPIISSYEARLSDATRKAHRVIRKSRSLTWLSAVCAVTSLASCAGVVYMLLLHFGVL